MLSSQADATAAYRDAARVYFLIRSGLGNLTIRSLLMRSRDSAGGILEIVGRHFLAGTLALPVVNAMADPAIRLPYERPLSSSPGEFMLMQRGSPAGDPSARRRSVSRTAGARRRQRPTRQHGSASLNHEHIGLW